ncbi:ATP synthase F1 subunit gamma [Clostridium sp. D2Q-11]|uniref:ATP synthase gamma chain n=1 Tax=Anaeromonas frigoriresistens TaxID=2683708 RepID=A0A942V1L0_9FIRM|nr:ATP synthase F1 subunit gamma [Anaeromonas frigoriresistens]MBS4538322.1 ATP synthase F1 subunit gamma [Anaeromonas frigoriresistens]
MAQESMQDIKRRIKSVGNTKQITKAMELVSSAKLKKSRRRLEKTEPYFLTVLRSIQDILASSRGVSHPMLENREVKNKCYIIVTSDRGLCGGYNVNIIKKVEEQIDNKDQAKMITIGLKGKSHFKRRDYDVKGSFTGISEEPTFMDATQIANIALKLYKDGEVDEVNIAYTQFKSTISHEPTIMKLLPAEEIKENKSDVKNSLTEYEPSPEEVLDYLIPKYVKSVIYGAMIESSASEQGARRVAMESATENAEEIIDDLTLDYNRARQAAITQEIAEIVGGAEALK